MSCREDKTLKVPCQMPSALLAFDFHCLSLVCGLEQASCAVSTIIAATSSPPWATPPIGWAAEEGSS